MRQYCIMLTSIGLVWALSSCHKSLTSSTVDSQVSFDYNGITYGKQAIVPSNVIDNSAVLVPELSAAAFDSVYSATPGSQATLDLVLTSPYQSGQLPTPGTYTYHPAYATAVADSMNPIIQHTFNVRPGPSADTLTIFHFLMSDTITITSIQGIYASGTFSATFLQSTTNPTYAHITHGQFSNVNVNLHPVIVP